MSELKTKWPGSIAEYFGVIGGDAYDHRAWTWAARANYQHALAEAAIERLKYLTDGLKAVIEHNASIGAENAPEWLEAIGPIPGEGK